MTDSFKQITEKIFSSDSFLKLKSESLKIKLSLTGINGSLLSFVIFYIYKNITKKIFFISHDEERIVKVKDDIELLDGIINISHYSSKYQDSESLSKILTEFCVSENFIVLTNAPELNKKIIPRETFTDSLFEIKKGSTFSFGELLDKLKKYNFNKKDFVEEEGDYSVRGGIIDFYSESFDTPVRIEFFGDQVESIREFDINSQRSIKEIDSIRLGINLNLEDENSERESDDIFSYLPADTLIIIDEPEIVLHEEDVSEKISGFNRIDTTSFSKTVSSSEETSLHNEISFHSKSQPDFHSNLKNLYNDLTGKLTEGYEIFITASDERQAERIKELIEDFEEEDLLERDKQIHQNTENSDSAKKFETQNQLRGKFTVISESMHSGFIMNNPDLLIYTEHQIFGRYFKQIKKQKHKFKGLTFGELKELQYGDYVVHRDFGIGIYSGLKKITVGNNRQEVVVLSYQGNDTLFLNLNSINLIKKYSAAEGHKPLLTRLGGGEWDRIKSKAKKQVKDIARDLILLYAKRKSETGFRFSEDNHWQKELEANFMYEDTPDQFQATADAKADMESDNPMDRLICGDVGFGKTEVAIRAAFKSVMDNKQVAVLVPTTILAVQHYNTFRDRLSPFAVDVECISRLKSKKEQKEITDKLSDGKINILIGTHRILSADIKFKDLGLLIIDEEQRFGVKSKEKLRSLKPNVDTLTLTATPIPRTLNFSLLGARDLSIINTPPKNRKPIITEIIKLDWNRIASIIRNELRHGGQVYFVNDKIKSLHTLGDTIKTYVPEAKIGIAHGQMAGKELEDIVIDFIEKKLNVLLCTKIIESGLDIPNVNTIIINNADMYGLAELYQLRGRVGRSDIQAFAYLIAPPNGRLTKTAVRRLQAIEEFTDLGSGFNLAMRDMEIRGVGNLLGKEQSGFVQEIGFDLFISIIEEAVLELKEGEFKELFEDDSSLKKLNETIKKKADEKNTIIESDLNALIPKDYIQNDTERLNIYRRLYELKTLSELDSIKNELKDRFGDYLEDVNNLFRIIGIKIRASGIGLDKIEIRNDTLSLYFPKDKEHEIFRSDFFNNLIDTVSSDKTGRYNVSGDKETLVIKVKLISLSDEEKLNETESVISL